MKKTNFLKFLIGAVCLLILLAGIIFGVIFSAVNKKMNSDYYTFGNDSIPSVKYVLGKRKMSSFSTNISSGVTTKTFHYISDTSPDDAARYTKYLVESADFHRFEDNQNDYPVYYAKESVDEGKLIVVYVNYTNLEYKIIVQKGKGSMY